MRLARRFAKTGFIALLALIALLAIPGLSTPRALAIWVVVVTALVLVAFIQHRRAQSEAPPRSRFEQALRGGKREIPEPAELVRMERELVLGSADADHAHRRLLPLLRATASARLAARHGIQLERRPEAARALLGENAWELLRPDLPAPADRHAPGVPRKRVQALLDRVESL